LRSLRRYEIFQKLPDNDAKWLESRTDLDEAKNRLEQLQINSPGVYFVLDTQNAECSVSKDCCPETRPSETDIDCKRRSSSKIRNGTDGPSAGARKGYAPPAFRRIGKPR
jgi:hypothetical protein